MKFIYAGKFDGDEEKLPRREHPEGTVPFKEPDAKNFAIISNVGCLIVTVALTALKMIHGWEYVVLYHYGFSVAIFAALVCLVPHEFLHAIWFRDEVYMYNNMNRGLLFVVGTEDMGKARFVAMSLCPNIVFGLIPFIIGWVFPAKVYIGVFGAFCLGMGFGDYINVWNAVTQMPKGAKTFLDGTHSYWYKSKHDPE